MEIFSILLIFVVLQSFVVNTLKSGMAASVTRFGWCRTLRSLIIGFTINQCTSTLQKKVPVAAIPNIYSTKRLFASFYAEEFDYK